MTIKRYLIFFVLLYCGLNFNAQSQTKFTLNDCISAALNNNYDLIFTSHQKDYDKVLIKSAIGSYLPNLNLNAGYSHLIGNTNNLLSLNSYSLMMQANLLIYDGGRREANYRIAHSNAKFTELQTQYLTEQLKLNVYSQFVNIIRLQEVIKIRKEDIEVSKVQLANLQARHEAGMLPIDFILSQEVEIGNKEILLLNAEIDVNTSKQILLTTMGLDPSISAEFDASGIPNAITKKELTDFRNKIGDLQNSINTAFQNRIDYSSLTVSREIALFSKDVAKSGYFPTFSANLGYGWQNIELKNFDVLQGSVGLNLSIPIFSNYSTSLQAQQSELNYQRENTALLKLEQSIKAEVQTAYFNLESSEKAIEISEKSLVSARRNFESMQGKMNAGIATITDYITVNTQYITAQLNNITSTYVYLNSRKNLLFTIGNYNQP